MPLHVPPKTLLHVVPGGWYQDYHARETVMLVTPILHLTRIELNMTKAKYRRPRPVAAHYYTLSVVTNAKRIT
jgi:hypothetical protein